MATETMMIVHRSILSRFRNMRPTLGPCPALRRRPYTRGMDLFDRGLRRLLGAIRSENAGLAFVGAALTAIGLVRRLNRPRRELLYSRTLRDGESLKITLLGPEDPAAAQESL